MSRQPRDVEFTRSDFGGGWIVPNSARARERLAEYFNEPPSEIAPIGGAKGWIVEPWQIEELAEVVRCARLSVEA